MIFAIDGTNWVHVLWHASGGEHVVARFLTRLGLIETAYAPERIVVAFDAGRTFRHEIYVGYKANRKANPEIADVLREVQAATEKLPQVVTIQETEFEADDTLATVARICRELGHKCVLASPDKDLCQCLVEGEVAILRGWKSARGQLFPEWLTAKRLESGKTGLRPDQWVDYQTLVGDSTDNVPGCKGIGEKTASALLRKQGNLQVIADQLQREIKDWAVRSVTVCSEKQRNTLYRFLTDGTADVMRDLVTLCDRVPFVADALDLNSAEAAI